MTTAEGGTVSPTRLSLADFATMSITFFSLGVTLQVVLIDTGTSPLRAFVASSVIFSATSQFAYLAVRDAGGGDWAAILAGLVVATRFGILAVSLSRKLPEGTVRRALAAVNVHTSLSKTLVTVLWVRVMLLLNISTKMAIKSVRTHWAQWL